MRSDAILERLTKLHPLVIDLSLGRVERLLAALGHPERSLPPVAHVAGTNGKGSTVAYLAAMAKAAGLRAHAYISPHLVRFHERITVAGETIGEDTLVALLEDCEAANAGEPITFFEITTAAAFLAFARTKADLCLLEVGLGGRFDATNVIDKPAVCAITPVSIDHVGFLGDTVEKIAFEKAGILKPGVPAVIGRQERGGLAVIEARAREVGAPLRVFGRDYDARDIPTPALFGAHQFENAAIARECAKVLQLPDAAIRTGIETAVWPGRLQRLGVRHGHEVWLDGGHNPAAAAALAEVLRGWGKTWLVFGMLNTRKPEEFLGPLAPYVSGLRAVAIPGEKNALPADTLVAAAKSLGIEAEAAPGLSAALAAIPKHPPERAFAAPERVLVCGSLYLVGAALAELGA
jgi:dihydrofolate synthase/folylpolyglutamate synthase